MSAHSSEGARFGVYIPKDLAKDLEECMKRLGIESKSRLIQEALRLFIAEHRWRLGGRVVGAIGVIYSHEVPGADEELTDVQHKHLEVVVSTVHVHLDPENCMLIVIVRGESEEIRRLVEELNRIRGVKVVRLMLMSV